MPELVRIRPVAQTDVIELTFHIACENEDAAYRFTAALKKAFHQLANYPKIGRVWESENQRIKDIRVARVRQFPNHLIFYRLLPTNGIEVVRVLHGSRDIDAFLPTVESPDTFDRKDES